jgi:hypothetical protein
MITPGIVSRKRGGNQCFWPYDYISSAYYSFCFLVGTMQFSLHATRRRTKWRWFRFRCRAARAAPYANGMCADEDETYSFCVCVFVSMCVCVWVWQVVNCFYVIDMYFWCCSENLWMSMFSIFHHSISLAFSHNSHQTTHSTRIRYVAACPDLFSYIAQLTNASALGQNGFGASVGGGIIFEYAYLGLSRISMHELFMLYFCCV